MNITANLLLSTAEDGEKKRQQYFQADSYSRKTNALLKTIIN